MAKLTEQQRLFCAGVAKHGNLTRAADEAGYATPNVESQRLVKKPHVAAEIERLRCLVAKAQAAKAEKRDRGTVADALEIREFYSAVMRGEETEEELSLSGDPVKRAATLNTRISAAKELVRVDGLAKPDKVDVAVDLANLSFAELVRIAKGGAE